ncbi:NAD(P)-dependent alcohol dehydrogenase [Plantactinospora veratri]|uniref:NAD(P)-dependent alcohol dehydrogenase n=1 Tax=Plantactinospora veratri TaxID=1436122 RepID=A0ABU7SGB5_9ACTN
MPLPTTAAVVRGAGKPFVIEQIVLNGPAEHEVLVRMVAAGMCHTDLIVQAGSAPFPLPGVLGHEGAGVVQAVGAAVTSVAPGDRVLLSFSSCGSCRSCHGGEPSLCHTWLPRNLLGGARPDGSAPLAGADGGELHGHFFGQSSFSALALADERSVVRVDPEAPLEVLAPLGCGVTTGVGTVFNVLRPRPGASIAVLGSGTVGLSAVMAAALSPAAQIIAVDRVPDRLRLARELGATDTVDTGSDDLAEALARLTGGHGVDRILDATGAPTVISAGLASLAVGGILAFVGVPPFGTTVPVDVNAMLPGRSAVGVTIGGAETQSLIPALVRLHRQGRLPVDRLVTGYDFGQIQRAADDVHAGRTIKPVLRFAEE